MPTNNTHVLARAVIIRNNHILLASDKHARIPYTFLPGGHIEHGESAESAVLRELQEELGIHGTIERFLGILEHIFEPTMHLKEPCHSHEYNLIFLVSIPDCVIPASQEDHISFSWQPLNALEQATLLPKGLQTCLATWLTHNTQNAWISTNEK